MFLFKEQLSKKRFFKQNFFNVFEETGLKRIAKTFRAGSLNLPQIFHQLF
jgi:hypothetical protein